MKKYFITFYSPGTFVSESTSKEVEFDNWNIDYAAELAHNIKERHGATPYGFRFETKESDGWEPKTTFNSGMHYLGGKLLTVDDIPDTKENEILKWNMKHNHIEYVIENTNSWKVTMPFYKDTDVLVEWTK